MYGRLLHNDDKNLKKAMICDAASEVSFFLFKGRNGTGQSNLYLVLNKVVKVARIFFRYVGVL